MEAQRTSVGGYIDSQRGELLCELVEVESGKLSNRPVLAQALQQCRRAKATLVIAKLDRLARNVAFVSSLMEAKTDFVAVDFPAANPLMLHILAAFAEHEREQISQRTTAALAAAKARGVQLGVNGARLATVRKAEALAYAETLRPILEPMCRVKPTLREIAEHLNAQGIRSREDTPWSATTVSRVLARLHLKPQGSVTGAGRLAGGLDAVLPPTPHPAALSRPERSYADPCRTCSAS